MRHSDPPAVAKLENLPNVGRTIAADLRAIGIRRPQDLRGRQSLALFRRLERVTGQRQDPCVLDTFIAVVRFVDGEPAKPWWSYTAERRRMLERVPAVRRRAALPAASRR